MELEIFNHDQNSNYGTVETSWITAMSGKLMQ